MPKVRKGYRFISLTKQAALVIKQIFVNKDGEAVLVDYILADVEGPERYTDDPRLVAHVLNNNGFEKVKSD